MIVLCVLNDGCRVAFSLRLVFCFAGARAVTGRGVSRVGYQTAEAMVVRKGFSVEQLRECLEEYADLNVVEVRRRKP